MFKAMNAKVTFSSDHGFKPGDVINVSGWTRPCLVTFTGNNSLLFRKLTFWELAMYKFKTFVQLIARKLKQVVSLCR